MKGCILLQNNFVRLGHAMAIELKNKYGVKDFCGYVVSRFAWNFINNQKDFKYTALLLNHDLRNQAKNEKLDIEYIKKMEKEYGIPSLWPFIDVDRAIMMSIPPKSYSGKVFDPAYSHEEMLKLLQVYFKNITKMLETEKPNFVVFFNIGSIAQLVLYYVAKKMGIQVLGIEIARLGPKITFSESYRALTGIEEIFNKLQKKQVKSTKIKEAEIILEDFREKNLLNAPYIAAEAENYNKSTSITSLMVSCVYFLKFIINYIRNPYKNDRDTEDPWNFFKNRIQRKLRKLTIEYFPYLYRHDKSNWDEDFAFFPLHYEPEISMSARAEFYRDQVALIRQIARSLPVHFKLYVKEHPTMVPFRPISYYKEIKRIPNVKLIKPFTKSVEIIKNAKLVITIAGTAGWEATLLKKPVISFGDVFYNCLSFVKRSKKIGGLPFLVKEQLENFQYNEQELINLLCALLEDTVDANILQLGGQSQIKGALTDINEIMEREDFKKLVNLLAKKLGVA